MIVTHITMVLAALLLAALCFMIATHCGNKKRLNASSNKADAENFLYYKMGTFYATSSNVGAMISFYVMIVGNLLMTFGWGSLLFFSMLGGVTFSLLILWWRLVTFEQRRKNNIRTIIDHVQSQNYNRLAIFLATLMLIFSISTIGSEIQAISILDQALSSSDGHLIGSYVSNQFQVNVFILLICIAYVLRGGYMGIVFTDVLQFVLIALFWLQCISVLAQYHLTALIKLHFLVNLDTVLAGISTIILIFGWIMGSCDTWIRTVGMSEQNPEDTNNYRSNCKRISLILFFTWITAMFIIATPAIAGLLLRDAVQNAYGCNSTEAGSSLINAWGFLKTLALNVQPLINIQCNLIAPSALDGEIVYEQYTKFTNFPFDVLAYMLRDYAQHIETLDELIRAMLIGGLGIMALLSAALTTVSSLMILTGQLLFELGQRHHKKLQWLANPWLLVALFGVISLAFSILPIFSDKAYLSIGVFAWASMVFLGMNTLFITMLSKDNNIPEVINKQFIAFSLWFVLIVFPHLFLATHTDITTDGLGAIQQILLPRSIMPISAILLSALAGLTTLIAIRKRTKN